jgi:ubiquinone/menaquinone biosynthesis C-methylase UbiE
MAASHTRSGDDTVLDLNVALQCPRCGCDVAGLDCRVCAFQMRIAGDIVHAIPPERMAHYARFMEDYARIRAAEGRGSEREEFYLGLPYVDSTGKNSEQWHIRSLTYDHLLKQVLNAIPPEEDKKILDLGAGNGWMSYRLALAGYRPIAVDLLINNEDGLGAAAHYRGHLREFFPRFQAEIARLPFRNAQFDVVIFNASFHYSEDYEVTLREAFRCAKEGGMVIISDTPWYSCELSGSQMVAERRAEFLRRYGTASNSIKSIQYLTDARLQALEKQLSIKWTLDSPHYGFKWAMRPLMAKLRNRREPSRFRIYSARKSARDS